MTALISTYDEQIKDLTYNWIKSFQWKGADQQETFWLLGKENGGYEPDDKMDLSEVTKNEEMRRKRIQRIIYIQFQLRSHKMPNYF